jgi:hypothetical protein
LNWLIPPLDFDRRKPYWGLVTAYAAQVHGFVELASRGIITKLQATGVNLDALKAQLPEKNRESIDRLAPRTKTPLLAPVLLASHTGDEIGIDTEALAAMLIDDNLQVLAYFNTQSAGALLLVAWELSKNRIMHGPVREFFRHCRNAAAHGGRFHFDRDEPRRPSEWRGKCVERPLQGSPLFPVPPDRGFLGIGDVLHLLHDVEKNYMTESSVTPDA